jgi:hypothetical protein
MYPNGKKGEGKMERPFFIKILSVVVGLIMMPAVMYAEPVQTPKNLPIEQPLVREGDFAVRLVEALHLKATSDETEAESILGSAGIAPRNGWIADYPVTPDILSELRSTISDAADSGILRMGKEEALQALQNVTSDLALAVRPYTDGEPHELNSAARYPDTSVINNYYYNSGPPIVTYYAPPPDYYYLYTWVPYPFWWYDFWLPGYFILHDFHRVHHYHNRNVFISNHFNDFQNHRVFRIDPRDRFHGKTYRGIGAPHKGSYLSTGIKRDSESIFNRNRTSPPAERRTFSPPERGRTVAPPSGGRSLSPRQGGSPSLSPGNRSFAPSQERGKTFNAPAQGGTLSPSSGAARPSGLPSGGHQGSPGGMQRR